MTGFPYRHDVMVVALLASPVHRYDGRPAGPVPPQDGDRREAIGVRAGYGVVGDRYAGRPAHRDAQLTVLAVEALEAVAAETGAAPFDPHLARRTVVLRGAEVEALRGQRFALDSGSGPVLLGGTDQAPGGTRPIRNSCAASTYWTSTLRPLSLPMAISRGSVDSPAYANTTVSESGLGRVRTPS
jgi:hypothetical protein